MIALERKGKRRWCGIRHRLGCFSFSDATMAGMTSKYCDSLGLVALKDGSLPSQGPLGSSDTKYLRCQQGFERGIKDVFAPCSARSYGSTADPPARVSEESLKDRTMWPPPAPHTITVDESPSADGRRSKAKSAVVGKHWK
jgi:hypothetical protein